jgi:predicted lipoprotein with Yx(FWY)xxD motif
MKKFAIVMMTVTLGALIASLALADHHAVKTATKEGLGAYLTDAKGMTLYWFAKDAAGTSNCDAGCLEKWPIYHRDTVAPPAGVNAADFGTITRADGQKQTTFRGWPLYYFVMDKAAGDTKGQGVKEVWFVIDPAKFPPK